MMTNDDEVLARSEEVEQDLETRLGFGLARADD